MNHDHDMGPFGGVGSDGRFYGGRGRPTRKPSAKVIPEWQVRAGLDAVIEEAAGPLTPEQLAHRLRIYLRDEYDTWLTEQEALSEVQKRQG